MMLDQGYRLGSLFCPKAELHHFRIHTYTHTNTFNIMIPPVLYLHQHLVRRTEMSFSERCENQEQSLAKQAMRMVVKQKCSRLHPLAARDAQRVLECTDRQQKIV